MSTVGGIVFVSTIAIAGLVAADAIGKGYNNIEIDAKNQKLELAKGSAENNIIQTV